MLKSTSFGNTVSELIGKFFGWIPIHPNVVTGMSVLFAIAGFALFFISQYALGFLFFLLAFFLDAVDGAIARAKNLTSKKGAFLDGISDRLVEFFVVLALFVSLNGIETQLLLLSILFFGTCMTAFVKAYAEHSGMMDNETAKKMKGILERAERSVLLLVALLLIALSLVQFILPLLALIAFLSFLTFAQRIWIVMNGSEND